MMSGCGILTNGKGTRREYGQCNLDELGEGDRIGLIRKSNGDLHFYVNGRDQGVAASNVPHPVWGVVDLYGRTVRGIFALILTSILIILCETLCLDQCR